MIIVAIIGIFKTISFEYWIEHVTFGLFYIMFRLFIRLVYRGAPGFATDCAVD